jgi:Holliday junction resolvasome RuvABC endonuclease subunit
LDQTILGLDLSLRATGIVAVPVRWGLDWSRVHSFVVGSPLPKTASERQRFERIDGIAAQTLEHARRFDCKIVAIEQYAFSRADGHAHERGELGGVVKRELFRAGLEVCVYHATSSRKLLGKAPRKGAKDWAAARLVSTGAPVAWLGDQYDAFLAANHHLSIIGGDALMLPAEAA